MDTNKTKEVNIYNMKRFKGYWAWFGCGCIKKCFGSRQEMYEFSKAFDMVPFRVVGFNDVLAYYGLNLVKRDKPWRGIDWKIE